MNKALLKLSFLTTVTGAWVASSLTSLLAITPNLSDGIICVAKGKQQGGRGIYFYTSVIDDATFSNKRPVSVTMLEKQVTTVGDDLVVIDKKNQTVSVTNITAEYVSAPEAEPVARAQTTLTGAHQFSGKTQTGVPITFTLEKNYSVIKLTHAGQTYSGVCH